MRKDIKFIHIMRDLRLKDTHLREVVSKSLAAFILRTTAAVLGLLLNIVLARMLGVEEVGVYFLAITIVTFFAVMGRVGLDNTLIRFIASYASGNDWKVVNGIYRRSMIISTSASLFLAIIVYVSAPFLALNVFSIPKLELTLRVMAFGIPAVALFTLHAQALQGLKRIAESMTVLSVIVPLISIILAILLVPKYGLLGASVIFTCAASISLAIGLWRWNRCVPVFQYDSFIFPAEKLFKSCTPLFVVAILQQIIVWSGNVLLGIWEDSAEVGLFSAANRTAAFVSFVLIAVNAIAAPKFAVLYHKKEYQALADLVRNTTKIMILIALPILIIFVVFKRTIMGLFGEEFIASSPLLVILAIGQFVNVTTGSVGMLLTMTGFEKIWRNNMFIAAIATVIMGVLFIPWLGATGAAIATAAGLSFQMILAVFLVYRYLGIMTIPFFSQPSLRSKTNNVRN